MGLQCWAYGGSSSDIPPVGGEQDSEERRACRARAVDHSREHFRRVRATGVLGSGVPRRSDARAETRTPSRTAWRACRAATALLVSVAVGIVGAGRLGGINAMTHPGTAIIGALRTQPVPQPRRPRRLAISRGARGSVDGARLENAQAAGGDK